MGATGFDRNVMVKRCKYVNGTSTH